MTAERDLRQGGPRARAGHRARRRPRSPRPTTFARELATRSPDALAAAKRLFNGTWTASARFTFARERAEQLPAAARQHPRRPRGRVQQGPGHLRPPLPPLTDLFRPYGVLMRSEDLDELLERARAWAEEDPDQVTRAELTDAIAAVAAGGDHAALADRFAGTLEFGTAGLRGALGAGPNRMNRVVVIRAAAGLAAYLLDQGADRAGTVVIGYDARHNSDVFARDTAEVMTGAGLQALRAAAAAADPAAGVRDPRARLRGRRDGDREPQPAAGQRLQGLPRRRQPDRAAGRRGDRRRGSRRSARWPTCRAATPAADARRGRSSTPTSTRVAGAGRRTGRATCARLHPAARRRRYVGHPGARGRRLRAPARRRAAGAARPGLPDRRLPQPRGARRDGPRDGARRASSAPTWWWPTTPTPTGAPSPCPAPARLADAARRRGRALLADHLLRCGQAGRLRRSIVSSLAARQDRGRRRPAVRRDADRVQVDRPGRRARVRLRGGARLLRGPRARAGQGRRLRAAAPRASSPPARRRRAARSSTCSTTSPREHGLHATDQLSVRVSDLAADRRRDGRGCGGRPPPSLGGLRGRAGRRPRRRRARSCRPPTACATGSPTARA